MHPVRMALVWTSELFDQFNLIIIYNDHMKGARPFHLIRAPLHLQVKLNSHH